MSLRLLPYENVFFICHYETCFCFVLQIYKLAFLYIIFMKRLCPPRVFTPFNTLFIFVIYFQDYCFISRYLLPITVCIIVIWNFTFCSFQRGRYVTESALERKKFWFPWLNWTGALLFSHVLYFLFGVWQVEIGMRLSGVFCLKPGEIRILVSWPLVPNSKVNSKCFEFLVGCLIL